MDTRFTHRCLTHCHTLQPTENHADRALQRFDFDLPPNRGRQPLILIQIDARGNKDKDWTNLSIPEFR